MFWLGETPRSSNLPACVAMQGQTQREIDPRQTWIFVDAGKRSLCFLGAPREKVWNLIKPFSGGAALIRDSLNKQQVPHEKKEIYMLWHALFFTSWLLFSLKESCRIGNRWTILFQAWGTFLSDTRLQTYSLNPAFRFIYHRTSKGVNWHKTCFFC